MTLPTYEEAYAKALDRPAFSNGTESECWFESNCYRCVHDAPFQRGTATEGCPLIMVAYMERTPAEWMEKNRSRLGDQYTCIYFRDEDDPGPDEPTPIPDPPGQDALFPRESFERPCRMFADTRPVDAEVVA
ncbi:hypothetical protein Aph01nite_43280 [Acrocarpospora phusangensis]|uniref:Uncharacterized protein n=1 Tax=Acrocarpospora phusangensis TaxID=1070424 RepID=A0A919QC90_9ACTN|nr:hypothetical protein [Acrocarpospora phusangensis]GIH26018.1 hypothetical protein Aph01nite_43280 [Acrocarpospora phusangensis]